MLKQLTIRNFALIEECSIPFGNGFSAITGETGAGKSVLMGALRVVVGGKPLPTMVRHGAEKASVEAIFEISGNQEAKHFLETAEIEDEGELVVQREIFAGGKSRARINGTLVNQATLQGLGEILVQIHGQSDQLLLRDLRTQLQMLDAYAETTSEFTAYEKAWKTWTGLSEELLKREEEARQLAEQKEFLTFQKNELEKANLKNGEEAELEARTSAAAKAETQMRAIGDLRELFDGENGLLSKFESFQSKLRHFAARLPEMESWATKLEDAYDALSSVDDFLRKAEESSELDPAELDRANARLAQIQRLKRKYRTDEAGLIDLRYRRCRELETLENLDSDLAEIRKKQLKAEAALTESAEKLSQKRNEASRALDSNVEAILHTLGMPRAKFVTDIREEPCGPSGKDRVEFCLAPNVGEGQKPLRQAVSGGELSRVLLAFESVLAKRGGVSILVFDEVDSGISGEIGNNVGDALKKIGENNQVLAITHLQQVACRAASQLAVEKRENGEGRTISRAKLLSYEERIVEIARMLGDAKSPTSQAHAKELLEEANATK